MTDRYVEVLNALPDGSSVAVVTMTGSCCPVTLGHIQCFIEARQILIGQAPGPRNMTCFNEALGFLSMNGDGHVSSKMREKGLRHICYEDRAHLVRLAAGELPWMALNTSRESCIVELLVRQWPKLNFVRYAMNGADDVLKYQKWKGCGPQRRGIVMGRPGVTERLAAQIRKSGLDIESGCFIVGPELPDISSTAVRAACAKGDRDALLGLLHPQVAEWCLTESPYKPKAVTKIVSKDASTHTTQCSLTWKSEFIQLIARAVQEGRIDDGQRNLLEEIVSQGAIEQQEEIRLIIQQAIYSSEV